MSKVGFEPRPSDSKASVLLIVPCLFYWEKDRDSHQEYGECGTEGPQHSSIIEDLQTNLYEARTLIGLGDYKVWMIAIDYCSLMGPLRPSNQTYHFRDEM